MVVFLRCRGSDFGLRVSSWGLITRGASRAAAACNRGESGRRAARKQPRRGSIGPPDLRIPSEFSGAFGSSGGSVRESADVAPGDQKRRKRFSPAAQAND